jgi:mRNA interferase MazF
MNIVQGAIVLVNFIFTDLGREKIRPALIVSGNEYNTGDDVVVAAITSNGNGPFIISLRQEDFLSGGLKKNSYVKTGKLMTIEKNLLIAVIGELSSEKLSHVKGILNSVFE